MKINQITIFRCKFKCKYAGQHTKYFQRLYYFIIAQIHNVFYLHPLRELKHPSPSSGGLNFRLDTLSPQLKVIIMYGYIFLVWFFFSFTSEQKCLEATVPKIFPFMMYMFVWLFGTLALSIETNLKVDWKLRLHFPPRRQTWCLTTEVERVSTFVCQVNWCLCVCNCNINICVHHISSSVALLHFLLLGSPPTALQGSAITMATMWKPVLLFFFFLNTQTHDSFTVMFSACPLTFVDLCR